RRAERLAAWRMRKRVMKAGSRLFLRCSVVTASRIRAMLPASSATANTGLVRSMTGSTRPLGAVAVITGWSCIGEIADYVTEGAIISLRKMGFLRDGRQP